MCLPPLFTPALSALLIWALCLCPGQSAAPTAPAAFKATAIAHNYIGLSWVDSSTNEAGFEIQVKKNAGSFNYYNTDIAADSTTRSIPVANPVPGTTYLFQIRAYNLSGATRVYSPYTQSNTVTSPGSTAKFDAPSNFAATTTTTTFNLTWTDNATVEDGYEVRIKTSPTDPFESLGWINATSVDLTGGTSGTTYYFELAARKAVLSAGGGFNDIFYSQPTNPTLTAVTKDAITSPATNSGSPGTPFSHTFTNSSGSPVTSRILNGVPASLNFNSTTGELTGTYPPLGYYPLGYTVNFADGWSQPQTLAVRVFPVVGSPVVGTLISHWIGVAGSIRETPLAGTFTDASAESAVRITTTKGEIDLILYNAATPATVTNFLNYVNPGDYNDVVFHRAPQNFVLQGGAFKSSGAANNFVTIRKGAAINNEPGIPNIRGTLSMVKAGNDPNSATNQFFISMQDNRTILDGQNGGFTVFGRVAGSGMTVVDAINALPEKTYTVSITGSTQTSFDSFPVDATTAPDIMDPATFVKMSTVTTIPTINYSITANTNPSVATAAILNGQLRLTGLAGGLTSVTLTATNLDNLSASQTINVQLSDSYATWAARNTFQAGQSAASQNPDGDTLNNFLEYAFLTNQSAPDPAPEFGKTSVPEMTLTFPVRKFAPALVYTVQVASNLSGPWTDLWTTPQGFADAQVVSATDLPDRTVVTIRDILPIATPGRRFMQIRVTEM